MSAPFFTPAARSDLSQIWDFTAERWDAAQADRYTHEIFAAAVRITTDPDRGRRVDHLRSGYWNYRTGSHLLFYTVIDDTVTVVRIPHQRMDPTQHL